jgi:hypothetical protein
MTMGHQRTPSHNAIKTAFSNTKSMVQVEESAFTMAEALPHW